MGIKLSLRLNNTWTDQCTFPPVRLHDWLLLSLQRACEPKLPPLSAPRLASTWPDQAGKSEHSKWGRRLTQICTHWIWAGLYSAASSGQCPSTANAGSKKRAKEGLHTLLQGGILSIRVFSRACHRLLEQPRVLLSIKLLGAGPLLVAVFLSELNYALDEICSRQYLHKRTDSVLSEVKGSKILKD